MPCLIHRVKPAWRDAELISCAGKQKRPPPSCLKLQIGAQAAFVSEMKPVWTFLVWVKQLIISSVLAWAGVNFSQPDRNEWPAGFEQIEPGTEPCHARRVIILRAHQGGARIVSSSTHNCSLSEETRDTSRPQ